MPRPVHTKGSGKAEKPNGRKQFNASLPKQLVLDFNVAASAQGNGRRDALLEEVLLSFLAQLKPDSKSVRSLYRLVVKETAERGQVTKSEAERIDGTMVEREALAAARAHAEKIVKVTSAAMTRKGPKRVVGSVVRKKQKRVS
jgi:hypothetical protein